MRILTSDLFFTCTVPQSLRLPGTSSIVTRFEGHQVSKPVNWCVLEVSKCLALRPQENIRKGFHKINPRDTML